MWPICQTKTKKKEKKLKDDTGKLKKMCKNGISFSISVNSIKKVNLI